MENENTIGKRIFVHQDSSAHIQERHGILMSNQEIAQFVDSCSKGQEGIYVVATFSGKKTFVIRGTVEYSGKTLGVFRTMWQGDEERHPERTSLPVFRVSHPDLELAKIGVGIIPYFSG